MLVSYVTDQLEVVYIKDTRTAVFFQEKWILSNDI